MSHPTYIERLAGREAAARARGRIPPVIGEDNPVAPSPSMSVVEASLEGGWTIGSVVAGRFVLQQRLGRGRYGPIYKALDRSLSEALVGVEHYVALQEMHPRIADQATLIERLNELPFHPQSWSHPNIVKLLELGRDGAKYFLCQEHLEGASLRFILDSTEPAPLEEHEVFGVLRSVGDALNYAHAKGIVHGDLRPGNVFVTETYKVKVLDFLPCAESRPVPIFVEDPATGGEPHASDDVYGLACLAYELMTGRHPYNGNSPIEALRAGLSPHPPPNMPPLRWQALARGLALRRERRTATVAELLAGLGITGTEALSPPAAAEPKSPPAAPSKAKTADTSEWPEIVPPPPEPVYRAPEIAESPESPPTEPTIRSRDRSFTLRPFDDPADGRALRRGRFARRRYPVKTAIVLVAAAAAAVFVYRDAALRLRAADLISRGVTFATTELARLQTPATAPAPARVEPAPAADGERNAMAASGAAPVTPPVAEPRDPTAAAVLPPAEAPPAPAAVASSTAPPAISPAPAEVSTPDSSARVAAEQNAAPAAVTGVAAVPATGQPAAVPPSAAEPAAAPIPQRTPTAAPAPGPSRFEFAARTVTVRESDVGARVVIRRTGALDAEANVVWWTTDGTAMADDDYAVLGARIETFAVGEESRVVLVPLIDDSRPEQRESFIVHLRADNAGARSEGQVEVVVVDDDN